MKGSTIIFTHKLIIVPLSMWYSTTLLPNKYYYHAPNRVSQTNKTCKLGKNLNSKHTLRKSPNHVKYCMLISISCFCLITLGKKYQHTLDLQSKNSQQYNWECSRLFRCFNLKCVRYYLQFFTKYYSIRSKL